MTGASLRSAKGSSDPRLICLFDLLGRHRPRGSSVYSTFSATIDLESASRTLLAIGPLPSAGPTLAPASSQAVPRASKPVSYRPLPSAGPALSKGWIELRPLPSVVSHSAGWFETPPLCRPAGPAPVRRAEGIDSQVCRVRVCVRVCVFVGSTPGCPPLSAWSATPPHTWRRGWTRHEADARRQCGVPRRQVRTDERPGGMRRKGVG